MTTEATLCPKKQSCGSCGLSDITYEEQTSRKLKEINTAFQNAHFNSSCTEIIPSPQTSNYRNRMDFVVDYRGNFGLREKGKWWKVIDDHTCFIPDKKIIGLYKKIYPWIKSGGISYFDRKTYQGLLRYVVIRTTLTGESMIIVVTSVPKNETETNLVRKSLEEISKEISPTSFVWSTTASKSDISFGEHIDVIYGAELITENINGYKYKIRPNSFFQTNSSCSAILQNIVMDFAKRNETNDVTYKGRRVLDLYCGSGFFTIPLSAFFSSVTGVELIDQAIADARENARLNSVSANFECIPAEKFSISGYTPDILLLDPPRAGLHPRVLEDILATLPDKIVYVSCKYARFLEEMQTLKMFYGISECVAVDMFPHTPHIEVVSLLNKLN